MSFASNRAASVRRTRAQVREEYLCQTWVETFWEELDAKCAALGWTLSTACRAAGLDPDYLGALRRDGGIPTPLHLRLITKALGANYPGWLNLLYTTPDDWPDVEAKPAGAAISMAEPSQSPDQPSAELWPVEQLRLWGADAADPASVGPPQSGATQGGPDFPGRETNSNSANRFAVPGLFRVSPPDVVDPDLVAPLPYGAMHAGARNSPGRKSDLNSASRGVRPGLFRVSPP